MYTWLDVENPANKKLVAKAQSNVDTLAVFHDARALLLDTKGVAFQVGVYLQISPNVVVEENTGRGVVKPIEGG